MSKMEQIRTNWTNFRRNMAVFDRLLASFLTDLSHHLNTVIMVELLDFSESSKNCSNGSYLSSSSNRMEVPFAE